MRQDPALLIVANLPPEFRLTDLDSDNSNSSFVFNHLKYKDFDAVEIIINGMAFILTHYTADETLNGFQAAKAENIFSNPLPGSVTSIGISLSANIIAAKHMPAVNQTLLELAKILGERVDAVAVIWLPAKINIGFDYFIEAVAQYCAGGPFPVLIQIAISQKNGNMYETSGLDYFSDQEISLQVPKAYAVNDSIKRLVRIAHDIATNGKIDSKIEADGFVPGEHLMLEPNKSGRIVNVLVSGGMGRHLH